MEVEDFLAQYVDGVGEAIDRLVTEATPDGAPAVAAWAAYCEFAYVIVFLCDQRLGAALEKRGCGEAKTLSAIETIDQVVLMSLLSRWATVTPGTAEQIYLDHHQALVLRADGWLRMRLFPPEDALGAGGTLIWEVPAHALAVASNTDPMALMKLSLRFQMMLSKAQIPAAMEFVSRHVE